MVPQPMPVSEPSRVFISYAHKDGAVLAQRLLADLTARGIDAWLDNQRLRGGATWTQEIETALDETEYVLALLTPGSYVSDICRAEQLRALRKGKLVIPLLAQSGTEIPLYLAETHYRDFTADSRYAQAFAELLADLHARNGIALKPEFLVTSYVTVPPVPVSFVERPEALAALRNALFTDNGGRHIALTALEGMGGIGKTMLAQALCRDEVVQQAFPDGVVWISVGKESSIDLTRMREVGKALGDDLSRYENELAAKNQYRSTIRKKAALIVVDDVWRASDLEPLQAEDSPRSRLLFTTRNASIAAAVGARRRYVDLLTAGQARELLARRSGKNEISLPPIAEDLIRECGRVPLALSMVGAMLHDTPTENWSLVSDRLRNADIETNALKLPSFPYSSLQRVLLSLSGALGSGQWAGAAIYEISEKHHIPISNSQRIFLCHSSRDKKTVRELYHRLLFDGFNPWLDEQDILPGQEWELEITKSVRSSAVVLVCLSANAVNQAGYMHKEIRYALDVAAEQPEGTIFLIPVRLDECDVPERLRRWHWVNLFEERGYNFLLKALAAKGLP
jgi:hypothetical protein